MPSVYVCNGQYYSFSQPSPALGQPPPAPAQIASPPESGGFVVVPQLSLPNVPQLIVPQSANKGLVADLCKIIERQSQEIASLVQTQNTGNTNTNFTAAVPPSSTPPVEAPKSPSCTQVVDFEPQCARYDDDGSEANADDENVSEEDGLLSQTFTCGIEALTAAAVSRGEYDGGAAAEAKRPRKLTGTKRECEEERVRQCSVCGTTETPKWRCNMTLCNACGLRSAKRMPQAMLQAMPDAISHGGGYSGETMQCSGYYPPQGFAPTSKPKAAVQPNEVQLAANQAAAAIAAATAAQDAAHAVASMANDRSAQIVQTHSLEPDHSRLSAPPPAVGHLTLPQPDCAQQMLGMPPSSYLFAGAPIGTMPPSSDSMVMGGIGIMTSGHGAPKRSHASKAMIIASKAMGNSAAVMMQHQQTHSQMLTGHVMSPSPQLFSNPLTMTSTGQIMHMPQMPPHMMAQMGRNLMHGTPQQMGMPPSSMMSHTGR